MGTETPPTITLWRPVGPVELELIRDADMRAFPSRLPHQPIFYPVIDEAYADRIASEWNAVHDGGGHVLRFEVDADFAKRYPVQEAGGRAHKELWVPAEEMDAFNAAIVGRIELVSSYDAAPAGPR